jgi:hypothetical protein
VRKQVAREDTANKCGLLLLLLGLLFHLQLTIYLQLLLSATATDSHPNSGIQQSAFVAQQRGHLKREAFVKISRR